MSVQRKGRYWEVRDEQGELVCLTVYRKGAVEVTRRLQRLAANRGRDEGNSDASR